MPNRIQLSLEIMSIRSQKATNSFSRHPFVFLLFFLLIAYLPVLLPWFHLKNDLITQNLPTRYFVSESLYSGYLPWWNPFINFGVPQYGDMNHGFWNPVQWLIAKTSGYSVLSITLEELLYILLGGWGTFLLLIKLSVNKEAALISGMAYMGGGFIVGHLQHFCWITGAAFFPYVLLYFLKSIDNPTIKNLASGSIFTFLFLASTHPGLVIGAGYFFLFLLLYLFTTAQHKKIRLYLIKVTGVFLLGSFLFSTIVIVSNIEVITQMTRGTKVPLSEALNMSTTLKSYISLLFPSAVNKGNFYNTDISMRNIYIGILSLIGLVTYFLRTKFKINWILITGFIFFLLLSGGLFKELFYYVFPFLGHVRLGGEFTYFLYLFLIIVAAKGLNYIITDHATQIKPIPVLNYFLVFFIIVTVISGFYTILTNSTVFNSDYFSLKSFITNLTFFDLFIVSGFTQIAFLLILKRLQNYNYFLLASAANIVIFTWLALPFTGLGQLSRKEVQNIISSSEKGINTPILKPIKELVFIDQKYDTIIGSPAFYSKTLGFPYPAPYPTELKTVDSYFKDASTVNFINNQAFIFVSKDSSLQTTTTFDSSVIQLIKYSPTHIKFSINNTDGNYITLLQNNYPRWKVLIDGNKQNHFTIYKTFIGIKAPKGNYTLEYVFYTNDLKLLLMLNLLLLLTAITFIIHPKIKNRIVVKNKKGSN